MPTERGVQRGFGVVSADVVSADVACGWVPDGVLGRGVQLGAAWCRRTWRAAGRRMASWGAACSGAPGVDDARGVWRGSGRR
jgi:hypothetical protein